jgi:hypothetical protein
LEKIEKLKPLFQKYNINGIFNFLCFVLKIYIFININIIILGGSVVSANQLREKYLSLVYKTEQEKLYSLLQDQKISITIDETTDELKY